MHFITLDILRLLLVVAPQEQQKKINKVKIVVIR